MPFLVDSISRTGSGGTRPGLTALEERIGSAAVAAHDPTVWETVDPDGRIVALDFRGWRHILETHRELQVERQVILDAVSKPDRRSPGHDPGEEWFYRRGFGASQWIKVVVHYEDERGLIVTAFPRRSFP